MDDGHIFDYSLITEGIYIGSDLCKGNICSVHNEEFKQLGVCAEINLSQEKKESPPDSIDMYLWLPVVNSGVPTPDQMDVGTAVINQTVENQNTIYVHCKNGHGRSPTLVAAYLIRYKGLSVQEAIDKIKNSRPEAHPNTAQIESLEKYYQRYRKN